MIIYVKEEYTVKIDFASDLKFEHLTLVEDFGDASNFTKFDQGIGEILFTPEIINAGTYDLFLTLMSEN